MGLGEDGGGWLAKGGCWRLQFRSGAAAWMTARLAGRFAGAGVFYVCGTLYGRVMAAYIGALDQGTTSTRFMVFDRNGRVVSVAQKEHEQIYPHPGWVEHDALEIWRRTLEVVDEACEARALRPKDLAAIGITNQRETTVVWSRETGLPIYNALVWQDTRVADMVARFALDGGGDRFRAKTGLPLTTYFSGLKIRWLLDHVKGAREDAEAGRLLFGNMDSYLAVEPDGRG